MVRHLTLAILLLVACCSHAWAGKRVALAIGNSNYKTGPLRNPGNDVDAISAALRELQFEVTVVKNADLATMKQVVRDFRRSLSKGDAAFFYYSGHGCQVDGKNYLIPVGGNVAEEYEVSEECISADRVLAAMEEAGSNLNVLVLDSCRNNPFARSWTRSAVAGLAPMERIPKGALIAYATAPGTVALDGAGANSPYTSELVAAMRDRRSESLELVRVFRSASQQVRKKTGQSPWLNFDAGMDEFLLWANSNRANVPDTPSSQLVGDRDLDASVGKLVDKLATYLSTQQKSQVSIGPFTGPTQYKATAGPGIDQMLRQHLARHNIQVEPNCGVAIHGQYDLVENSGGHATVQIQGRLVDDSGKLLTDFKAGDQPGIVAAIVDKPEDVVQLLGTTTQLYVEDTESDRDTDLRDRLENPQIYVDGNQCSASEDSPYLLQILVDDRPRPILVERGLGYVELARDQTYTVRLVNKSPYEAACHLSIDGISVFAFSQLRDPATDAPRYQHYIIPPQSAIRLKGWHKTNASVDAFRITGYAESAAAKQGSAGQTGTITALFSAAWPKGSSPPHDEQLVGRGEQATGFGPPQSQAATETQRVVGRLRAAVSVRYGE